MKPKPTAKPTIEELRARLENVESQIRSSQHEQQVHLTIDVGPHLSHLLKRLFPKSQQTEVDALTEDLSEGASNLKAAVEANTPKAK